MKILAISCSPRKEGNTEILLNEALSSAQKEGAETELYQIADKSIDPCDACSACKNNGGICVIKDDMQPLYEKINQADGIIFGTPVYYYGMAAQCKTIMDRSFSIPSMANKVGGIVVVAGSMGNIDAIKDLYFYFVVKRMLPANFISAYASAKGDVKDLVKCMQATKELGKQMVKLIEMKFEYPLEYPLAHYAFGTHTR
ncbi:MAG: flavodoxin family protein [Dehalococcoidales bacterium]|nr:MAG: flavodoxin family protein [Dehalococcoidales bacterium]